MAVEVETSHIQICDANGDPVSGARIYIYDVGTTTLKTVYSDTALSVAAANPIITDSAGRHAIRYIATGSYKYHVKTSADVSIYDPLDNVDGRVPVGSGALAIANGGTGATTASAALSNLGGATAAELADVAADVADLAGAAASTERTHIATGTTAQRPASPIEGDIRRNTSSSVWELYNGSAYENIVLMPTGQTDPSATDSAEGLIEIAVQSEMETGTDTVRAVSPGRQHFHQSAAKFWVKFAGASGTIATSYNVTSVSRGATGTYTVTIANDFSSGDYAVVAMAHSSGASIFNIAAQTLNAGSVLIRTHSGGVDADPTSVMVVGFGDL